MKIKKHVIYVKKGFVIIKKMKKYINYIEKFILQIIAILQENLEGLLMAFVI